MIIARWNTIRPTTVALTVTRLSNCLVERLGVGLSYNFNHQWVIHVDPAKLSERVYFQVSKKLIANCGFPVVCRNLQNFKKNVIDVNRLICLVDALPFEHE